MSSSQPWVSPSPWMPRHGLRRRNCSRPRWRERRNCSSSGPRSLKKRESLGVLDRPNATRTKGPESCCRGLERPSPNPMVWFGTQRAVFTERLGAARAVGMTQAPKCHLAAALRASSASSCPAHPPGVRPTSWGRLVAEEKHSVKT